jgi:hypothetical protein
VSRVVLLENRLDVAWARRQGEPSGATRLVALTAEAVEALEAAGVAHDPVSEFANLHGLAAADEGINVRSLALATEIEEFIAAQDGSLRIDGPGFVSGQAYYLQYSVSAIARRALLVRDVIRALRPATVVAVDHAIDPWFAGDGYAQNPWLAVIGDICREAGSRLEVIPRRALSGLRSLIAFRLARGRDELARVRRRGRRFLRRRWRNVVAASSPLATTVESGELRLLMVEARGFDWAPVLEALRPRPEVACFHLTSGYLDGRVWTECYGSVVKRDGGPEIALGVGPVESSSAVEDHLSRLFDRWLEERDRRLSFEVAGIDIGPGLIPHLRALVRLSPALARHADAVATRALDVTRPHAVAFTAVPTLAAKRLVHHSQARGIPVVCYQHGFGYGVQLQPKDDQTEPMFADYFLTYGPGIRPPSEPLFPLRAAYVPVGSSRIERMLAADAAPRSPSRLRVLWLAESSNRNTHVASLTEDTRRHLLQQRCLGILAGHARLEVIYRPYEYCIDVEGTAPWLRRVRPRGIRIDVIRPLDEILRESDLVIVTTSSPTTWAEVIALKRPLILFCDPKQTFVTDEFAADLARICRWCRTPEELVAAVVRLAAEPDAVIKELHGVDRDTFIEHYVLGAHGTRCVDRTISFLANVCRDGMSLEPWVATWAAGAGGHMTTVRGGSRC